MSVIVGRTTVVNIGQTAPISSIDWSIGANTQRFYTLGAGTGCIPEFAALISSAVQVNFSAYGSCGAGTGGSTPRLSVCSSVACDSPAKLSVSITPGACSGPVRSFNGVVYVNSYSYNKDRQGLGTETWSCVGYIDCSTLGLVGSTSSACVIYEPVPSHVVLGVVEGTLDTDDGLDHSAVAGIEFVGPVTKGFKASVQSQGASVGDAIWTLQGPISRIGNSQLGDPGVLAKANVTLNHQPIYIKE